MRRWILLAVMPLAALAQDLAEEPPAPAYTNLESNVESTKAWRRYYVFRSGSGEFVDPTGTLSTYAKMRTMDTVVDEIGELTDAAFRGMNDALDALYALTNLLPTVGCSLKLALTPDRENENFWAHVAAQETDGTTDTVWYWFSQELATPPKMSRRYYGEYSTGYSDAEFPDGLTRPVTTNGFENCHRATYRRPEFAKGVLLVPNNYVKIGRPSSGIAFASAIVTVDGRTTLTGIYTNSTTVVSGTNHYEVVTVDNGVITAVEDVAEGDEQP